MTRGHLTPPTLRGTFLSRDAYAFLSPGELRHHRYTRVTRGVRCLGDTPADLTARLRAARLILPDDAVFSGMTAAAWFRPDWVEDPEVIEVMTLGGRHIRSRVGYFDVKRSRLKPTEYVRTRVGLVTTPARTFFDLARRDEPRITVPVLDALVRRTGLDLGDARGVASRHSRVAGIQRLRQALALVDPGSESPRESLLRVILMESGVPRPRCNHRIFDGGRFVARVDLAWLDLKIAVEYDGEYHDDPSQVARDRVRLNALKALGWTVLVIDRAQFRNERAVVALVQGVLRHASFPALRSA